MKKFKQLFLFLLYILIAFFTIFVVVISRVLLDINKYKKQYNISVHMQRYYFNFIFILPTHLVEVPLEKQRFQFSDKSDNGLNSL